MKKRTIIIGIVAVLLFFILVISGIKVTEFSINPSQDFYLSEDQLNTLKLKVEENKDNDAAWRIIFYYEVYKKDTKSMMIWLEKASELGNKEAQLKLAELKKFNQVEQPKTDGVPTIPKK